jgi:hypothetical protein
MAVELSAAQKRDEGIVSLGTRDDIELAIRQALLNGLDRWRADLAHYSIVSLQRDLMRVR